MRKKAITAAVLAAALLALAGCGDSGEKEKEKAPATSTPAPNATAPAATPAGNGGTQTDTPASTKTPAPPATPKGGQTGKGDAVQVAAQPESITVLVNKQFALPDGYAPKDLVYPNVAFTFKEKSEKKMMRKEAAAALETMFAASSKDGVKLAGVSAYRSNATQRTLFNNYVAKDGLEKARTYSAVPGHSEHETGLAIDVSGIDGKCAATDCFGGTKEAEWLAKHAAEYGFIIRYPKGKESITGYQYEPWHLRYVGTDVSGKIASKGLTLEEYFNAVPVSK